MIKRLLEIIELPFIITLALIIFLTMPFMLEAMEKDAIASINWISTICFFFYAMYKISKSSMNKVRSSKQGSKQ